LEGSTPAGGRQHLEGGHVGCCDSAQVDHDVVVESQLVVERVADLERAAHVEVALEHQDRTVGEDLHRPAPLRSYRVVLPVVVVACTHDRMDLSDVTFRIPNRLPRGHRSGPARLDGAPRVVRMVNLTRIYTRTGDAGTTRLGDMSETTKTDLRLLAYADVDEANSQLGYAIAIGDLDEDVV